MSAFVAHYLDPMLRSRADVERLPVQVLAEIPPAKD
jgi:hypothetical protein